MSSSTLMNTEHKLTRVKCNCLDKNATRIGLQAAPPTTTHAADIPRPQRLQASTAQSGRILCQPGRKAPPGSTALPGDRYTCHPPGSAGSRPIIPSIGGDRTRLVPSARRPVTATNAAIPGLQIQKQQNIRIPQGGIPGHTPIVPEMSANQPILGRLRAQPTAGGESTRIFPWRTYSQTPQSQTLLQTKENTPVTPSVRLYRPKVDGLSTIPSLQSSDNIGHAVARCLTAYGTTLARRAAMLFSSFWQPSSGATSWIGFCVEKVALLSFKHGLAMKKGLELYR